MLPPVVMRKFQGRSKKSLNDSFLGEEYEEYSIFKYVDLAWMRMDLLFQLVGSGGVKFI